MDLLAISVGNTRTQIGRFSGTELEASERISNEHPELILSRAIEHWGQLSENSRGIALASVNESIAGPLAKALQSRLGADVSRLGTDLGIPVGTCLDEGAKPGTDRLLNAAAAWDKFQCATVVIDAGTAVTVDFVDGKGVFQGGAIAPGVALQLRAMHDGTAGLPLIAPAAPTDEPFGKCTEQAMLQGVHHGIRGLVQRLVERYAEAYGAFPRVIATGGDAEALFAEDDVVEMVDADLTLQGIAAAVAAATGTTKARVARAAGVADHGHRHGDHGGCCGHDHGSGGGCCGHDHGSEGGCCGHHH